MTPRRHIVELRFGHGMASLSVPPRTDVLVGSWDPPLPNPAASLDQALRQPIGSPPLLDLLQRRQPRRVAITISDITRPVPNRLILPRILDVAAQAGIPPEHVTIIIGTGMHRPSTPEEKHELLGPDILATCPVVDHHADDPATLITVADHPPVRVCRPFVEADFRLVTGLIEPHFMAGFSGGRKGVCPALVDLRTIQRFHGYETLDHPRADNGILEDNPCHRIALDIARKVGVDFLVNVAITQDRQVAGIYCGDLEQAHAAGCRDVATWARARVGRPYDLVITSGGGYPLDQTLYQTVKGMCTALPALRRNGTLLQLSHCGEGIGSPAYRELLLQYGKDWRRFLADIASRPEVTRLDQWEFQVQCRVLKHIGVEHLLLATDGLNHDTLGQLALHPVEGDGDAVARAQAFVDDFAAAHPSARIAVIPEGPYTLPIAAVPPSRLDPETKPEPEA